MRRTIFLALVAALLIVPAAARAADPTELIRDCADDGVLQGDYSTSDLRNARSNLPTDIDEYSDCRDVLARALAAKTSSAGPDNGGSAQNNSSGAGPGTDSGTDGPVSGGATPDTSTDSGSVAIDPGVEAAPETPQDYSAINDATENGDGAVPVQGRDISPRLAAQVGRNDLPGTVLAVLALVGAAALAVVASAIRRRVVAHHQA
jgi:hypothetical protein